MADLKGSEYFHICGEAWQFFKSCLPVQKSQCYWDRVISEGNALAKRYEGTQFYDFATAQVTSYINEIDRLSKAGSFQSLSSKG